MYVLGVPACNSGQRKAFIFGRRFQAKPSNLRLVSHPKASLKTKTTCFFFVGQIVAVRWFLCKPAVENFFLGVGFKNALQGGPKKPVINGVIWGPDKYGEISPGKPIYFRPFMV